MELLQESVVEQIWHHIGFPKQGGIYQLENPESNEEHYAYFDNDFKIWHQGFSSYQLANTNLKNWLSLSRIEKIKNLNRISSAWQKLSWSEV